MAKQATKTPERQKNMALFPKYRACREAGRGERDLAVETNRDGNVPSGSRRTILRGNAGHVAAAFLFPWGRHLQRSSILETANLGRRQTKMAVHHDQTPVNVHGACRCTWWTNGWGWGNHPGSTGHRRWPQTPHEAWKY